MVPLRDEVRVIIERRIFIGCNISIQHLFKVQVNGHLPTEGEWLGRAPYSAGV